MPNPQFTQNYNTYSLKDQGIFPIKETDWNRLKRLIRDIIPHERWFRLGGSILLGISGSSMFALITLSSTTITKHWVEPTHWIILLVSLILGVALLILDSTHKDIITNSASAVLDDMSEIEEQFEKVEDNN